MSITTPSDLQMYKRDEKSLFKLFEESYQDVFKIVMEMFNGVQLEEARKYFEKVMNCNVPHGKKTRGFMVVLVYVNMVKVSKFTSQDLKFCCLVGWCLEILQAFGLMQDDIMDQSETRRGRLCWYKEDEVGFQAVNNAALLQNSLFHILKFYLDVFPCTKKIMELFIDTISCTLIGQLLDMQSEYPGKLEHVDQLNMVRYSSIVNQKSAYYSFCVPFKLGMIMVDQTEPDLVQKVEKILLKMGHLFQIQDDFLDCYGDPEVTGKIGTDIPDGKCTWLVIKALELCTKQQKTVITKNYGRTEPRSVELVKEIYNELDLKKHFGVMEETVAHELEGEIREMSSFEGLSYVMLTLLQKIFKRNK